MLTQLHLPPYTDRYKSIHARFRDFHAANPQVYAALVKLARQAKARGHDTFGMKALFEILRWEWKQMGVPPTKGDEFFLNNDFSCLYAEMVEAQELGFKGFFVRRKRRAV